jgi:hypothetical protein
MAARTIPPEVADRLARLTIEEREAINQAEEERKLEINAIKVRRNSDCRKD